MLRWVVPGMLVLLVATPAGLAQVITTVAGTTRVLLPEGVRPSQISLRGPRSVAVDSSGTVYFADENLVLSVPSNGLVRIVAGNHLQGFSGEGGSATSASLNVPFDLAFAPNGDWYIADAGNGRVRRVSANGTISTVAVLSSPRGVAVDLGGRLYVSDFARHQVFRIEADGSAALVAGVGGPGFSGDGGPATQARLNEPRGMVLDRSGNLYVADGRNNRIRRITPSGVISTFAGNGMSSRLPPPAGDGGAATDAVVFYPSGLAMDAAGSLFINELGGGKVRKVTPAGIISTVAYGSFFDPEDVAVDGAGNLYVADFRNSQIKRVTSGGNVEAFAGDQLLGFSGDGGRAIVAEINQPQDVAMGSEGSLFIADTENNRVRAVRSGTVSTIFGSGSAGLFGCSAPPCLPAALATDGSGNLFVSHGSPPTVVKLDSSGRPTTVAGGPTCTQNYNSFPDGIPATQACLGITTSTSFRMGVAADSQGNLYVATWESHKIRKIDRNGVITTVAGSGAGGFSGDGGPALAASLFRPFAVAVDGRGQLYIADSSNGRVRRVDSNGIITTIAGGGPQRGDGGLAVNASLSFPVGLAFDAAGNLYIAETGAHRIRKVDAAGVITTVAGNGTSGFSGDGGPATAAQLSLPKAVVFDPAGNMYIADTGNNRIRVVSAAPALEVTPLTFSFSTPAGSPAFVRLLQIASSPLSVQWRASVTAPWLALSSSAGTTPASIEVRVDPTSLSAGSYRGTMRIEAPAASPGAREVTVDLTVTEIVRPQLAVDPVTLTFQTVSGRDPAAQTIQVQNAGGGSLDWTAQATSTGGSWLSLSRTSGSATPALPSVLQVLVNSKSLQPGTYAGSIVVTDTGSTERATVSVSLIVTAEQTQLLLSQNGLYFTAVQGDGVVPSQSFGVLNVGQGTMNWTARLQTTQGCGWLAPSPAGGSSQAGAVEVPLVEVRVNATGVNAGQYSCHVRVEAAGATGSPRLVSVFLQVLPPGSVAPPLVRPTGLIFVRRTGTTSPGSQTSTLATSARSGFETSISASTFDPGAWLSRAPTTLTISPAQSGTVTVQPTLGSLAPGQYFGTVDLKFRDPATGSFSSQAIEVLFVVTSASAPSAAKGASAEWGESADGCAPSRLFAAMRSLAANLSIPVGYPATVEVQVKDDCDNPVNDAVVSVSFSSGDPPIALVRVGNGIYTGSWRPLGAEAVRLTVRAQQGALTGSAVTTVSATAQNRIAAISPGGIVQGASFAKGALAPGSIVSVFGLDMAGAAAGASTVPLPRTLADAAVNIAGVDAPLYYASGRQINAQVPFEAQPGTTQAYLRLNRQGGSFLTDAETVTIVPAQPGVFAVGAPDGQGVIVDVQGRLVDSNAPAAAGDVVVVYATGLGAVDRPVRTGEASPVSAAQAINQPTVTIGGRPAVVQFAGLTPGLVGLYQINVQVPTGVTPGPAVPLRVTQSGAASNTVTLAIK